MIIALNPGHYIGSENYDPGAINESLGLCEVEINIAVAVRLDKLLQQAGYQTVYIHAGELDEITTASNNTGADLFISIHCNSATNDQAVGTETFYCLGSQRGKTLATLINAEMISLGLMDRGIKCDSLYVTRHTDAVAVLVELGFLSNSEEGQRVGTDSFQQATAEALCRAVEKYLG